MRTRRQSTATTTRKRSRSREREATPPLVVVVADKPADVRDEAYADRVRQAFRDLTGWKVETGKPIWVHLGDFSTRYSKRQREPIEVAAIFKLANGI
jgi:hypothetical protein